MGVVYLARHGQASFGAEDYDVLSELGHRQADVLGRELVRRGVRPDVVLTGSMRRQRDTALDCLTATGVTAEPRTDPRWNEYDHLAVIAAHGDPAEHDPQVLLDGALNGWLAAGRDSSCPETWTAFQARVTDALAELTASLGRGRTALVVTSGGVIGAGCAHLLGAGTAGFLRLNRVTVNASITKVACGRAGTNLLSFNDHAHLEGQGGELLSYR